MMPTDADLLAFLQLHADLRPGYYFSAALSSPIPFELDIEMAPECCWDCAQSFAAYMEERNLPVWVGECYTGDDGIRTCGGDQPWGCRRPLDNGGLTDYAIEEVLSEDQRRENWEPYPQLAAEYVLVYESVDSDDTTLAKWRQGALSMWRADPARAGEATP